MNQGFSYYFCMMIEGSGSRAGSGSISLTCGSGSGMPKNMWIRIHNTGTNDAWCRAEFHPSELPCTLRACLYPAELRCSLLSYTAPSWATLHCTKLCFTFFSYYAPLPELGDPVRYRNKVVLKCFGTGQRWLMQENRCRRHRPGCRCPAMPTEHNLYTVFGEYLLIFQTKSFRII
jgi:hypothetical protein